MHSPKLHLKGGVGVNKYLLFTLYLSLLRLIYILLFIYYSPRSMRTLVSCHVDNVGVTTLIIHMVSKT